jgi:hypothetical protein
MKLVHAGLQIYIRCIVKRLLSTATHRLVGHNADAVGEVASHHARQPLCFGDVLQPLPHAIVCLRVRVGRGSAGISRL